MPKKGKGQEEVRVKDEMNIIRKTWPFILLTILSLPVALFAGETYRLEPRVPDIVLGDGVMDEDTVYNPFDIYNSQGQRIGEIKPAYPDLVPQDGIAEPGSYANPYQLEMWTDSEPR